MIRQFGPLTLALGLLAGVLLAGTPATGQTAAPNPAAPAQEQEYPLHISAAQMEADQDQRLITFKGQVKADYGDYTLYSDKLLIYYTKEKSQAPAAPAAKGQAASQNPLGGMGADKIDHIEALGNVRFVQGDRVATGEKAIYYKDKDQIVLLGHPQVWRGADLLKGSRIVMHLATNKVEVESSPEQRVEAHLYQAAGEGKGPTDFFAPGGATTVPRPGRSR